MSRLVEQLKSYAETLEAMRVSVSLEASQKLAKVTPALSAKVMAEAASQLEAYEAEIERLRAAIIYGAETTDDQHTSRKLFASLRRNS